MTKKIKILSFIILILVSSSCFYSQVWRYPYHAMGLNYPTKKETLSKDLSRKVIEIDSSGEGVFKTFKEYDPKGRIIKEVFEDSDTLFYVYNSDDYWSLKITKKDTTEQIVKKHSDGKVEKIILKTAVNLFETNYFYDESGNIIKVLFNNELSDQCKYDSLNRIIQVESFKRGHLSLVIEYSYCGDTIKYTECSYDDKGQRYNWPCDEIKGVYSESNQFPSYIYTKLNQPSGFTIDILQCKFDEKGRVIEMSNSLSNGNEGKNYWHYIDNQLIKSEHFSNGELVRTYSYIYLNSENIKNKRILKKRKIK